MTILILWLLPAAAFISLGLTSVLRRYALVRNLVDLPNERSSHEGLIPTAGGVAIVVSFSGCLVALWLFDEVPVTALVALTGAGGSVALIGLVDDHRHVPAVLRLIAHFAAAAWALFWLGGMPALTVSGLYLAPGWLTNVVAAIYMVWLLNLYNFMDGIDGIASIEAITVCLGGAVLYLIAIPGSNHWVIPALLLVSVAGFLYWNYPPARIFLGDAGSGFLGITFGVFSIQATWINSDLFWAWAILLGTFIVDATVTLIRRAFRGRRLYQAHRTHAYQHAARRLGSHKSVSLIFGAINLIWLLPVAALVAAGHLSGGSGLLVTYIPLVILAVLFRAGVDELTGSV